MFHIFQIYRPTVLCHKSHIMGNLAFYSYLPILLMFPWSVNTASVVLQCINCKSVTDKNITAGSGRDITLTYYIKKKDFSDFHVYLEYDGDKKDEVVTVEDGGDVNIKQPGTKFNFNFTHNQARSNDTWYWFPFSVMNISEVHEGKILSFKLNRLRSTKVDAGKHTFVVAGSTPGHDPNDGLIAGTKGSTVGIVVGVVIVIVIVIVIVSIMVLIKRKQKRANCAVTNVVEEKELV